MIAIQTTTNTTTRNVLGYVEKEKTMKLQFTNSCGEVLSVTLHTAYKRQARNSLLAAD